VVGLIHERQVPLGKVDKLHIVKGFVFLCHIVYPLSHGQPYPTGAGTPDDDLKPTHTFSLPDDDSGAVPAM
jgi:hypothetical protein